MIEVDQLTKRFGPTLAIDRLSFQVPEGTVCGFLGPNGAGKSTTLRILTGFMPPTAGRASIAGHDVLTAGDSVRRDVGYLPESNPLYPEMRVEEYLHFRGGLMGMTRADRQRRIAQVCDRTGLAHQRRRVIGHLSKGNRQRVGLAQALLHDPRVLVLDEPTSGLDPTQIEAFRGLLGDLRQRHTILLSSHILPEIERTAGRVIIIARGRIVAEGSPDELRRQAAVGSRLIVEARPGSHAGTTALAEPLGELDEVSRVDTHNDDEGWQRLILTPRAADGTDDPKAANAAAPHADAMRDRVAHRLHELGCIVRELRFENASLEQLFIQVTGRTAAADPDHAPTKATAPAAA